MDWNRSEENIKNQAEKTKQIFFLEKFSKEEDTIKRSIICKKITRRKERSYRRNNKKIIAEHLSKPIKDINLLTEENLQSLEKINIGLAKSSFGSFHLMLYEKSERTFWPIQ